MEFKDLIRDVEKQIRVQGADVKDMIKSYINDSILEFARLEEWGKLKVAGTITLDDSNSYNLKTIFDLTNDPFLAELRIIGTGQQDYWKLDYQNYIIAGDKSYWWSVLGNMLYVTGTAVDINFIYKSVGKPHPLVKDADENKATLYYPDIIKQMAVIKFFKFMGDIEDKQIQYEQQNLNSLLVSTRREENRIKKMGKHKVVNR